MVPVEDVIYVRTKTALCSYDVKSESWKDLENTEPKDISFPRPERYEEICVGSDGHTVI